MAMVIFMTGLGSGFLHAQTKGTGGAGGISPGTGETGGVRDIDDQTGPPGAHHPTTSPQGWGRMKGKAPTGAGKQGWRSIHKPLVETPVQGWEPKPGRPKAKSAAGPGSPGLLAGPQEKPTAPPSKGPKGPKGPKEPAAAPNP